MFDFLFSKTVSCMRHRPSIFPHLHVLADHIFHSNRRKRLFALLFGCLYIFIATICRCCVKTNIAFSGDQCFHLYTNSGDINFAHVTHLCSKKEHVFRPFPNRNLNLFPALPPVATALVLSCMKWLRVKLQINVKQILGNQFL